MNRIIICIIAALIATYVEPTTAADYPFTDNRIHHTYGDHNSIYYHDGIDFPSVFGIPVLAPVSGYIVTLYRDNVNVPPYNSYMAISQNVGDTTVWTIAHFDPNANLVAVGMLGDTYVVAGSIIGTVQNFITYNHIHESISFDTAPVVGGAEDILKYFATVQSPLLQSDSIFFTQNEGTAINQSGLIVKYPNGPSGVKTIYGDVDIVALARTAINGEQRSGVYKIEYEIIGAL